MKVFARKHFAAAALLLLAAATVRAQIKVVGNVVGVETYNVFATHDFLMPLSSDIQTAGDVFVSSDLEIGGRLHLDAALFMSADPTPFSDQTIYFADGGGLTGESLLWNDFADGFQFSDDVRLSGSGSVSAAFDGALRLASEAVTMSYVVDSNGNAGASSNHRFIWYNNGTAGSDRVMQLESTSASGEGNLFIDGTLTENENFDVAEAFWSGAPIEPGTLMAVDPARPDGAVPSSSAYDPRVVGVVSTSPGVVLGGHAFTVEKLAKAWGDEVVAAYGSLRLSLELAVYVESPGLEAERDRLYSAATWTAYLKEVMLEGGAHAGSRSNSGDGSRAVDAVALDPEDVAESYQRALADHRIAVDDAVMQRFFAERFALVALAGRVPVRVDADYGSIEPGDQLTASPTPGVAMKADRPSMVVGTALEALPAGQATISMLVGRYWYPGDPLRLAADG